MSSLYAQLIRRSLTQVAVLTAAERLLLTLIKLAITCTCTALAALTMSMQSTASSGVWSALDNANGALVLIWMATFCVAVSYLPASCQRPSSCCILKL